MTHPTTPKPDAPSSRTSRDLCPARQDILPVTSGYHDFMEKITEVKRGFAQRLYELRSAKGVSAREMSLSLGQGAGYISNLENAHNLPSMAQFFAICEYLGVMPGEFFAFAAPDEGAIGELLVTAQTLEPDDVQLLLTLARKIRKED